MTLTSSHMAHGDFFRDPYFSLDRFPSGQKEYGNVQEAFLEVGAFDLSDAFPVRFSVSHSRG